MICALPWYRPLLQRPEVLHVTDLVLREQERRFRATGDVRDEAAYLLLRVRGGDLARKRLELAALLGHRAAILATLSTGLPDLSSDVAVPETGLFPVLSGWLRELCSLDAEAGVRAALACCEAGLPLFEKLHPGCREPRAVLHAIREWLADQTWAGRARVVGAALAAEEAVSDATLYVGPLPERTVGFASTYCGLALADEAILRGHGSGMLTDPLSAVCHAASTVAAGIGTEQTARSICESLVPWALGGPAR